MTLPRIEFDDVKTSVLTLGIFAKEGDKDKVQSESKETNAGESAPPDLVLKGKRDKSNDAFLVAVRENKFFFGKKKESALLRFFPFQGFGSVLLVGLGSEKKWDSENARQAGATVFLAQRKEKLSRISVNLESFNFPSGEMTEYLQAFCEGYLLSGYRYQDLLKDEKPKDGFEPEVLVLLGVKSASHKKAVERARILTEAVNFSRSLGDRPGNLLTPTIFGDLVSKMAKNKGLKCTVWGKKELEREKMGLFLGVAQGSSEEPKLIFLEYRGGKKEDKPIVLIGKGLTFDSGGISLKPADKMEDMKYDMMGGATVAGVFHALGELKPDRNVVGLIASTENMPGGRAQKPGDVQRSFSGKTVEIINTDAEGRLVLADALEYAQKAFEPQAIIDFATLTGAVVVALGSVTTGIMGNHRGLISQMENASEATGERVWELPLYDEYEDDLKSSYADYRNSGTREAGSSKAGVFLRFFVDSKIPWVHCDIAGSSYHRSDLNYNPHKYGTGVMVRLITHLIENWKRLG